MSDSINTPMEAAVLHDGRFAAPMAGTNNGHRGAWVGPEDTLTQEIIAAAIEVHRNMGPGLLESIYEQALLRELQLRKLAAERQVAVDVLYKGVVLKGQRIDLIVEGKVAVEFKSASRTPEVSQAQALSYLKSSGLRTALIINFGMTRLVDGVKRVSI